MKTILISHVYQKAKPYLADLFDSLNSQTDKDFDVVIFNYGLDEPLSAFGYYGQEVFNVFGYGIPDARDWALKYALEHRYELLVFVDADDVMAPDRIEKTKGAFENGIGFFYTDLHVLSQPQVDFFSGKLPDKLVTWRSILECNFVGLSNFAINVQAASRIIRKISCPIEVVAYDWYLATILLLEGLKGLKVDSITFYRLHDLNTAGRTNEINSEILFKTVTVKMRHYKAVKGYCVSNGITKLSTLYEERYLKYKNLYESAREEGFDVLKDSLNVGGCESSYWWNLI